MKNILFLFAISALAITRASAQSANPDTATEHFITKASIGNLHEINSGQIASQKGVSAEVRSFGSRMVTDHTSAQSKLMQLAKAGNYQIPPQATGGIVPDPMLKKASGKDFDRVYVHMMVPDHRQTILLFQTYALSGKDPAVKAFAQQTLPILKSHLASIKAIDDKMKDLTTK